MLAKRAYGRLTAMQHQWGRPPVNCSRVENGPAAVFKCVLGVLQDHQRFRVGAICAQRLDTG